MKLYFTARQLPNLEKVPLQERLAIIANAQKKLTLPEKLFLNLIKLFILTSIFVLLTGQFEIPTVIIGIIGAILLYPLLLRPIHLTILSKYLEKAPSSKN